MLTVEIKLNGEVIAKADILNMTDLSEVSDYRVRWVECANDSLNIPFAIGTCRIEGHRRRQSVWVLIAKASERILGQMIDRMESKR